MFCSVFTVVVLRRQTLVNIGDRICPIILLFFYSTFEFVSCPGKLALGRLRVDKSKQIQPGLDLQPF